FNVLYMVYALTYSDKTFTAPSDVETSHHEEENTTAPLDPTNPRSAADEEVATLLKEYSDYYDMTKTLERSLFMIGFAVILSSVQY
ncbi:hypothetical protein H0H87_003484, partial [Tephrocybe sp. NHM501043]